MRIEEEDHIEYDNEDQLSFLDTDENDIQLYVNGMDVGNIKVYQDSEMDGREYICLNYTIIYLDVLVGITI